MEGSVATTGKNALGLAKSLLLAAVPITIGLLAAGFISGYIPKSYGGTKA